MRLRFSNNLFQYTIIHAFAISFPEHFHANNMAIQSNMPLCRLDMEQHELLPIVVAYTFMQLKMNDMRRKLRWWT